MKKTLLIPLLLVAACDESDEATPALAGATAPTWHADAWPVIERRCAGCHQPGGIGPFDLSSYEAFSAMAGPAMDAIESGRMPPWQADPDCRHYQDERIMAPDEKTLLADFVSAGMLQGDPLTAPQPQLRELPPPDRVAVHPDPYLPDESRPDDYRCLPLDVTFEEDVFLAGTNVRPDASAIVHHVLVYLVPPKDVARLEELDARDEGPGYTCYGGPGVAQSAGPLAAWVPGFTPLFLPEGIGQYIPKGSRLVMQMHYNVLAAGAIPDQTALDLYYWDEPQPNVATAVPQPDLEIIIPAGEARSKHVAEFVHRGDEPMRVVGTTPHMHVLGTEIRVEVVREDGSEECLVSIDDWDFNWQQAYRFLPDEEVLVHPGDRFRLTCIYDNSPENQPFVNGEQRTPRDVSWGEGTHDEMCLNFINIVRPFDPNTATQCGGFDRCRADCDAPGSFGCLADCAGADRECGTCVVGAIAGGRGCARETCLPALAGAADCLRACAINALSAGGSLTDCMAETCPTEYAEVEGCIDPIIASGACDEQVDACVE